MAKKLPSQHDKDESHRLAIKLILQTLHRKTEIGILVKIAPVSLTQFGLQQRLKFSFAYTD